MKHAICYQNKSKETLLYGGGGGVCVKSELRTLDNLDLHLSYRYKQGITIYIN